MTQDPMAGAAGTARAGDPGSASTPSTPGGVPVGHRVVHRRYVPHSHAHYAGNLVEGAYVLALFGDVATEMMIRTDADEGLFASYSDVQFHSALRGGDVVEVSATLVRMGRRSREMRFEAHVTCRGAPDRGGNAADVLAEPLLITSATGTVVAPA